ncbi:SWI/SNF complex subunit [Reticulomyxa filosa]|uniref:SWI/SNF complex subunit n=1 Tax=Reticulomyxa filosa TaxID=46433 RepID=X6M6N2_RETFI|nr:SWI/SNF complex subunit [Reticulomyxa filosa]|eukprot:ETO09653.1 SWI/SNF complex subunit [Reticulomyxa filosa]
MLSICGAKDKMKSEDNWMTNVCWGVHKKKKNDNGNKKSHHPRPATRIDAHVINDFDLNGGLRHTLGFVLSYGQKQKWNEIPFDDPTMHSQMCNMFQQLWRYLREKNFIPERRIYLDESLDIGSRNRLAKLVERHGAELVDHPSKASHVQNKKQNKS